MLFAPRGHWRFLIAQMVLALLVAGIPVAAATPATPATAVGAADLRFVHVTDAHWVAGGGNANTRKVLAAAAAGQPQLVIHGGDTTETGGAREYDEFLAAQAAALPGVPAYYTPGNHDARWLDPGKALFRARVGGNLNGRTFGSFTRAGVHFVLLDSAIEAETHGHFDATQLNWLRSDLAALPPDMPVLVFFHHPLAYTPVAFMDTETDLLAVLGPYNIRGVFTGHGHLHMRWQRNGIPFFMTQAADEGGYKQVDIGGGRMRVFDGSADQPPQLVADLPLARPAPDGHLTVTGLEVLAPPSAGRWRVTATAQLPAGAKAWYRIDAGKWQPLTPTLFGVLYADFTTTGLAPGVHRVQLWAAPVGNQLPGVALTKAQWDLRDVGPSWTDHRDLTLPPAGAGGPTPLWQFRSDGGVQAAPAVSPERVVVATRDGSVTALNPATGAVQWQYKTDAPVVGSPALSGDRVAVGDTSGTVTVLDASTGKLIWSYRSPVPVTAEPLWAARLLFVADSAGTLTALDRLTGARRWQQKVAAAAIRARPTYANGTLFFGAWDRTVYAVDVLTGQVRWRRVLPGSVYYSPANQPVLYHRGRVFVTRTPPSSDFGLYALDARDGRTLWTAAGGYGYSAPVLHGGLVTVASGGGSVVAYDPITGARRWSTATGIETFDGALSAHGGDLVLGGLYGWMAAVRPPTAAGGAAPATTGTEAWRYSLGDGYVYARPASDSTRLFAGSMDGTLHAFGLPARPEPALSAGSPGIATPRPVAATFADAAAHPLSGQLGLAQAMGLVGGYPDGTFRPGASLTRAELAALQARYLGLSAPSKGFVSRLADSKGHWAEPYIAALEEQGLVQGEQAPTPAPAPAPAPAPTLRFAPDRPVTRAEAVQILARLTARPEPAFGFRPELPDVIGHWVANAAQSMFETGLLAGVLDTTAGLQPDRPITRAEATALLVKAAAGR